MTLQLAQLNAEVINGRSSLSEGGTMRATVLRPRRLCIAVAAVVAGLLLAGCNSSTTSSPGSGATAAASSKAASSTPSPTSTSAVCQAAAELRTSVNTLTHVKIGAGTVDEIKSDLANVEAKLTALTTELQNTNKTETTAAKSAVDALKAAVSEFTAHPSSSTLHGVTTAVGGVTTAVGNLLTSLAPHCGSAPASPTP